MGHLSCLHYFASGTQCRQLPSTESVAGPAAMRCGRGRTRSTRDTLQSPRHDLWALGLCTPEMFMAAVICLEPWGLSWHTPGPLSSYLGLCQLPPSHLAQRGHRRPLMLVTQSQPSLWSWMFFCQSHRVSAPWWVTLAHLSQAWGLIRIASSSS